MEKTKSQSIISGENYEEIRKMLESNDEGSKNIALTILEQSDYSKSEIYILCILKQCYEHMSHKISDTDYINLFTTVKASLNTKAASLPTLSFRKIYEIAVERDKKKEIQFMLTIFKEELMGLLNEYGFTFLEYLDIEIKPKKIIANE